MNLKDITDANATTLAALRAGAAEVDFTRLRYYGYYMADIFECPPFVMFTNNDCPRARNILFDREFEPTSMKLWCRLVRTATGILDVGAHVGVYSLAAAALRPELTIHAFEPNPLAYARLRMHKAVNGFGNIVEHWFAVGNADNIVDFSWVAQPGGWIASGASVMSHKRPDVEKMVVPMRKLDGTGLAQTLGQRPLMKIDVEGAELPAVKGMREVLALDADIILESFEPRACEAIDSLIQSLGYNVFKISEKTGRIEQAGKLTACDPHSYDFNQLLTRRNQAGVTALVD